MRRLALAAALALGACIPEEGPLMRPGSDCMECHGGGGGGEGGGEHDARTWTIAGTVYDATGTNGVLGANVRITDANGWSFTLRSNLVGNFYSAESVAFPLRVTVDLNGIVQPMEALVDSGSCNGCHTPGGQAARVYVP